MRVSPTSPTRRRSIGVAVALLIAAPVAAFDGAQLYAERCADCHGPTGQGTDHRRAALAGDLPISELARVIAETMPEGDPESCVGAEAEAIARHMHADFYSPLAQARLRPPRRELSRLTGRQIEQSLADLVAAFRGRAAWGTARGLRVEYSSRQKTDGKQVHAERIEPGVDISFAASEFLPEEVRRPPTEAEIRERKASESRRDGVLDVRGGLLAPKTGDYEFIVRSPNGFSLNLNGAKIIDGAVRTGEQQELRTRLRLVGGRVYPLSLNARQTREPDLRLRLLWKAPGGVEETIPARFLSPSNFPLTHATTVKLPPDDRSAGYVRGANVSAAWDEAVTRCALELARAIVKDLPGFAKIADDGSTIPASAAASFSKKFAEAAFRRPLTGAEEHRYASAFYEPREGVSPPARRALELSLLAVLKSPQFLYPELALAGAPRERRADYAVATRLALGLWDSLPDERLTRRADRGRLATRESAAREAERMLGDTRTRSKLAGFFEHWLRLDHAGRLARDPTAFPDFNDRVAADMRASLDLFLEDVVWNGSGDLRQLFLSDELFVNERLAMFLGLDTAGVAATSFVKASAESPQRAGVVTHPFLVTAFSYYRETSPIHRGVFLARNVLGRDLRPPPEAVAPLAPELAPDMTTRERVATQTSPGACQACHVLINDLGFTLEHFDAVGRFRHVELDRPIDASGGYIATDGRSTRFNGARDLAYYLASSEDVHRSFVTQLFEHVAKQPILAYGVTTRERLLNDFRRRGFNIPELLSEIAVTAALAN